MEALIIAIVAPTTIIGGICIIIGLIPDKNEETPVTWANSSNARTFK